MRNDKVRSKNRKHASKSCSVPLKASSKCNRMSKCTQSLNMGVDIGFQRWSMWDEDNVDSVDAGITGEYMVGC